MKLCKILFLSLVLSLLASMSMTAQAQHGDRHPAYLHALSDLRMMRAYLSKQTPNEEIDQDQAAAIDAIDSAIREIKAAAIDDGKDINDHVPLDAHLTPANRWTHAREFGNAAWHDVATTEDDPFTNGLRKKALAHIAKANTIVDHIIDTRHFR